MSKADATTDSKRRRTPGRMLSGTNLERAGDHNQRVTLQAIRNGAVTRAELVEITGLTAPAIANITKRLLDDGLIREAGRIHGGRGQPALRLAINAEGCFSIGVNLDRDHITVVLLDFLGQVRARATREIAFALPDEVRAFLRAELARLVAEVKPSAGRVLGVGVALPDDMAALPLPHRPASYDAWRDLDLSAFFQDLAPYPVFVENDAAAAALGELQFGHGLRHPSFFYILVTSGLGGGLVIEGNYFRGAQGRSGEIGFLPVRSPRTSARSLQEVVSLSALYEDLAKAGLPVTRPDELERLPPEGQAVLDAWISLSAELLAEPLISVSCVVNPEAIYIGGRLPGAVIDRLAAELNRRLAAVEGVPALAPVSRAAMAADAPAIGAAILPFSERLLPTRSALMKTETAA